MASSNYSGALNDFGSAATLFGQAAASSASARAYDALAGGYHAQGQAFDTATAIADKDARLSGLSTAIQKVQTQRQIYQTIGGARADIGAAGFGEHGSAIDVLKSSAAQGELQMQITGTKGQLEQDTFVQQSTAYAAQAKGSYAAEEAAKANASGARASATAAKAGGVIKSITGIFKLFCWVAREVYGVENKRWEDFRDWNVNHAPVWFFLSYQRHGERFAAFIRNKPILKFFVRGLFDLILNVHEMRQEMARAKYSRV